MKLWKGATFAFMLCGAALSILLVRNMATNGHFKSKSKYPPSSSSRSSSSSESATQTSPPSAGSSAAESTVLSRRLSGLHRRSRSTDNMNSLFSEFSIVLQRFTEGELQHVVGNLLDRKTRKSRRSSEKQGRRTKGGRQPCSLKQMEVTVTELGLGYESDETLLLHYCSGDCWLSRKEYDIAVKHVLKTKKLKGPCCRPTVFEKPFSFLDNRSRYHTIHNVSAKICECV